jgi:VanZ family protein
MRVVWRWLFRFAALVLLTGLSLPPSVIDRVRDLLSALLPVAREVSDAPGLSFLVHFALFLVVSALLFRFRDDLGWRLLLAVMVTMSFVMEGVQLLVDGRYASWVDAGVNLLGVAVGGLIGLALLAKARQAQT